MLSHSCGVVAQAERWGAELYTEDVESIDLQSRPFTIVSGERTVKANSVIIATGATAKRLGIPSEQKVGHCGLVADPGSSQQQQYSPRGGVRVTAGRDRLLSCGITLQQQ